MELAPDADGYARLPEQANAASWAFVTRCGQTNDDPCRCLEAEGAQCFARVGPRWPDDEQGGADDGDGRVSSLLMSGYVVTLTGWSHCASFLVSLLELIYGRIGCCITTTTDGLLPRFLSRQTLSVHID